MALLTKPDMQQVWASGGDIVEPSDLKKQQGWTVEVPPHQFENWIQNRQDEYLAHINQRGIPQWDGNTEYEASGLSYVQGSNGTIYKSVAASGPSTVAQNPTTDVSDTYWTVAFADVGAFLTETSGDLRYTQRSNNLSDVASASTAFNNIKQNASETVTGVVEIATAAEAQAFTANKVIDGAKLAEAFKGANISTGLNGFQKLPGGLILQWGNAVSVATTGSITYPVAYPNAALMTIAADQTTNVNQVGTMATTLTSATAFAYASAQNTTGYVVGSFNWFSIGW